MIMELNRAHQVDVSQLLWLLTDHFGQGATESSPDVVVGHSDSSERWVQEEGESDSCRGLIGDLVVVELELIDVLNVWKDES